MGHQLALITKQLRRNPQEEPALKVGGLAATVTGAISLILYFAPNLLSETQLATIGILAAFLVPIITAVMTRGKVWSPQSVLEVLDQAVEEGKKQAETSGKPPPTEPDWQRG